MDKINNFNLIRLLAAIQVVLFHGQEHLLIESEWLTFFNVNFLRYFPGVPIFFFISGFLIYWSFERNNNITQYLKNRILRIYPALWMCLIITIVLLFIFSENRFNLIKDKSLFIWFLAQFSIAQFYTPETLRFWGVGTPNGSLWTIVVELQFYFLTPIIYYLRKKSSLTFYIFILVSIICNIIILKFDSSSMLKKLGSVFIAPYLYYFMFGILFYIYWDKIKSLVENKFLVWLIIYLIWSIFFNVYLKIETSSYWIDSPVNLFSDILLLFLVFSAATTNIKLSNKLLKSNDISYGVYIYHMLVINTFVHLGYLTKSYQLFIMLFITLFLGYLSWILVEKNSLRLKKNKNTIK
jgi:peptidoglycan/LPS O-acetylase OafA/YrhL